MRVVIDAVAARMGGALRHLEGLRRALGVAVKTHEFVLCVNEKISLASYPPNVRVVQIENHGSVLHLLLWQQVLLPRFMEKEGADLLISLLNFGPIRPNVRQIIFQRNPIYYCPYYSSRVGHLTRIEIFTRRWLAFLGMRASNCIVTPTFAMRDMIRNIHPNIPVDRFAVIRHGIDLDSFLCSRQRREVQSVLPSRERRAGEVWLLYASHPTPHKGLDVLVDILAETRRQGVDATLFLTMAHEDWPSVMQKFAKSVKIARLSESVVLLGRINQDTMPAIYSYFDIFLFPSLCESFGFPMVEALASGLPVVAAETPVNREILGDAALFYSPLDAKTAASQIHRLLTSEGLIETLKKRRAIHLGKTDWSWERYGRELLTLIEKTAINST